MWLYVPSISTSSPSAPEEEGLISASNWQFQALAVSCSWRGKLSPSRNWFQRWKRDSCIKLLFGAMPEPLTASAGVDAWTASLAGSRAKATVLPERSGEASTSATCGHQPAASSFKPARGSSSLKTSAACSRRGMTTSLERKEFGETFASWVSRLREDCSRRRKSARATSGNASSSSAWPTPDSGNFGDGHDPAAFFKRREEVKAKGINGNGMGTPLAVAASAFPNNRWPTPQARDGDPNGRSADPTRVGDPTRHGGYNLDDWAAKFVVVQVSAWPTPAVTDSNGARNRTSGRSDPNSKHHDGVTLNDAILLYSLPDPMTSTHGGSSSTERRTLNPLFVEWLMGWPPGWTDFACSATALSRFKQRYALRTLATRLAERGSQGAAKLVWMMAEGS